MANLTFVKRKEKGEKELIIFLIGRIRKGIPCEKKGKVLLTAGGQREGGKKKKKGGARWSEINKGRYFLRSV